MMFYTAPVSYFKFKLLNLGTLLVVQWLRFHGSTAGGVGSILGWGTKILHTKGA